VTASATLVLQPYTAASLISAGAVEVSARSSPSGAAVGKGGVPLPRIDAKSSESSPARLSASLPVSLLRDGSALPVISN